MIMIMIMITPTVTVHPLKEYIFVFFLLIYFVPSQVEV